MPQPPRPPAVTPFAAFYRDLNDFLARRRKPGCTVQVTLRYDRRGGRSIRIKLAGPWLPDDDPPEPPA